MQGMPDLLTPAPVPGRPDVVFDGQLDRVAATAQETVVEQLRSGVFVGRAVPPEVRDAVEAGPFARRAANGLSVFWRQVVAEWMAAHDVVETDFGERTRVWAREGLAGLLGSLHPALAWAGDCLVVDLPFDEDIDLADRDLVLSPTVLNWPNVMVQVCGDGPAVINYPVAGLADRRRRTPAALARLYGGTRAALLADLDTARSTAELSARHDVTPSTVSYHLRVLHQAGMVSCRREGAFVLYQRC